MGHCQRANSTRRLAPPNTGRCDPALDTAWHGHPARLGICDAAIGAQQWGQTASYIATQSEAHRHKLATLTESTEPSNSPRDQAVLTLLNLSVSERVAALRELMLSVEQEAPAELDMLWAELDSDI